MKAFFPFLIVLLPAIEVTAQPSDSTYRCGYLSAFSGTYSPQQGASSKLDTFIHRFYTDFRESRGGDPSSITVISDNSPTANYKFAAAGRVLTEENVFIQQLMYRPADLTKQIFDQYSGWVVKSIILHELGHFENSDPFTGKSVRRAELKADEFSGLYLARAKVPFEVAVWAVTNLADENSLNGYPSRVERIQAVKIGWDKAFDPPTNSLVYSLALAQTQYFGASGTKSIRDLGNVNMAFEKNSINGVFGSVFDAGEWQMPASTGIDQKFYIDSNYLYMQIDDGIQGVGTVVASNRAGFKKMVYDNYFNYLYVTADNQIYALNTFPFQQGKKFIYLGVIAPVNK